MSARGQRPARLLRQEPHPAGRRPRDRRGRDRQPARPQRRRPLDRPARRSWGWCRRAAEVRFKGRPIAGLRPDEIAHAGIGYVPEDRQVFPALTVRQNLELGLKRAGKFGRWTFDDMFACFPNLGERQANPAGVLSGGEQQMLTMCRTLMGDPDLGHHRRADRGPGAQAGRAGRHAARRDRPARHLDPAGRAEAHHRAENIAAPLRHGPRPHRLRGHARPSSPPMPASARSGWRFSGRPLGAMPLWLARPG